MKLRMRDLTERDWIISGTISLVSLVVLLIINIPWWVAIIGWAIIDSVTDATILEIKSKGRRNVH
jgi:cytoskeletal protein RodZ